MSSEKRSGRAWKTGWSRVWGVLITLGFACLFGAIMLSAVFGSSSGEFPNGRVAGLMGGGIFFFVALAGFFACLGNEEIPPLCIGYTCAMFVGTFAALVLQSFKIPLLVVSGLIMSAPAAVTVFAVLSPRQRIEAGSAGMAAFGVLVSSLLVAGAINSQYQGCLRKTWYRALALLPESRGVHKAEELHTLIPKRLTLPPGGLAKFQVSPGLAGRRERFEFVLQPAEELPRSVLSSVKERLGRESISFHVPHEQGLYLVHLRKTGETVDPERCGGAVLLVQER